MKKFPSLAGAASPPVRRLSVRYGLLLLAYRVDPVAIASGSPRGALTAWQALFCTTMRVVASSRQVTAGASPASAATAWT